MSQSSSRDNRGRNQRTAPKPTGFQKFVKAVTLGLVDLTPKKPVRKSSPRDSPRDGTRDSPRDGGQKGKRSVEPAGIPDSPRLYVGNLNYDTTDADLEAVFGKFGDLKSASIVSHGGSGRSKGFGFVEFTELSAAKEAVAKLHGTELQDRTIIVNGAKSEKPRRDSEGGEGRERREPRERRPRSGDGDRSGGGDRRERREGGRERGPRSGGGRSGRPQTGNSEDSHKKVKALEIETVSSPSLRVGSLNSEATDQDIDDLFEAVGAIQNRSETGAADSDTREYLIDLASTEEAQKAVELLDGKSFMGNKISVKGAGE